jgi:hypothetical protein
MEKTFDLGLPVSPGNPPEFEAFLDPERLLRLHPHWHVESVEPSDRGIRARLKDHATEKPFDLSLALTFPVPGEFRIELASGPVAQIRFFHRHERLHLSFTLHGGSLSAEEEQGLTLWLQSIRQYLRLYLKNTLYTRFFRMLMNRVMLKMNPSQRKISMMLYRFTVLEIVVILIILIGYFTLGR